MKIILLKVLFLLNFIFVQSLKLEEDYFCSDGSKSQARILILSPQGNYVFDRLLENYQGRYLYGKNATSKLAKTSTHIITITGTIQGVTHPNSEASEPVCITVLETPRVFSSMDMINLAEETIQRAFQKVFIAVEVETDNKAPLNEHDTEVLVSQLVLLQSLYVGGTIWNNTNFLVIANEEPSDTSRNSISKWAELVVSMSGSQSASDKTVWLTPSKRPGEVLELNLDQDTCILWDLEENHFFSKDAISWMGHPGKVVLRDRIENAHFECFLITESFQQEKLKIKNSKDIELKSRNVILVTRKARNDLLIVSVTLLQPVEEDSYRCVMENSKSINSVQVMYASEDTELWSCWSSWRKCDMINSTTIRYRSKGESDVESQMNNTSVFEAEDTPSVQFQTRACLCSDLRDLPRPRFLLLGPTGVGKSTLGNQLFGGHQVFASGHTLESKTDYISFTSSNLLGNELCITVIDTPGAKDTKGRDYKHTLEMQKLLKNEIKSFDVILLLVHGGNTRFDASTIELIKWYEAVFGVEMWKHVVIEITFWQHNKKSKADRWRNRKVTEDKVVRELTHKLHTELKVPKNIEVPIIFIDPMVQIFVDPCLPNFNLPEQYEVEQFLKYAGRLWSAVQQIKPFDCKSRCQAPDEFYSGKPWVYNLPNNQLFIDPGIERIVEWQIWEGIAGNASANYDIHFDDEIILQKIEGNISNYINDGKSGRPEFSMKHEETKILQKVASIKLHINVNPNLEIKKMKRTVSLSNGRDSVGVAEIFISQDAFLGPWTKWSPCSISCLSNEQEYGNRTRSRVCYPEINKGKSCSRLLNDTTIPTEVEFEIDEIGKCIGDSDIALGCPEAATWSNWGPWGMCSVSCGPGIESRSRRCFNGNHNGEICSNEFEFEDQPCSLMPECPRNCILSEWQSWSDCSKTCTVQNTNGSVDFSSQTRIKNLIDPGNSVGQNCSLMLSEETRICNHIPPCPVNCVWGDWSEWGTCSAKCGPATKTRLRSTIGPFHQGAPCQGQSKEIEDCKNAKCPVKCKWAQWDSWSECTMSCGKGTKVRSRFEDTDDHPIDAVVVNPCKGSPNQTEACNMHQCPQDGFWSEWYDGSCSVNCGLGIMKRYRDCDGPKYGGIDCVGRREIEAECAKPSCPVDCELTEWEDWSRCSVSCGFGERARIRHIEKEAAYNGRNCSRSTNQIDSCNLPVCPVDGKWSEWMDESFCSTTCGRGVLRMYRSCMGKVGTGAECSGPGKKEIECGDNPPCPVDCELDEWRSWTKCTATCGGGIKTRSREVAIDREHGGRPCSSYLQEEAECGIQRCPVRICTSSIFGYCLNSAEV